MQYCSICEAGLKTGADLDEGICANCRFPKPESACKQFERIISAIADAIYSDPHQWSTRPCPTCRLITAIIGKPFGCDRKRLESSKAKNA